MNIISVVGAKRLTNYRVNWEKIYELPTNDRHAIVYKGDGRYFILVDDAGAIHIHDTNTGDRISTIANRKQLELISWSECYNGEIVDIDSMFEYVEKNMPAINSVSNSILEDKKKFDFIVYGGEQQLNLSIFGIFNVENLIRLEGTFLLHLNDENHIAENYVVSQLDSAVAVYQLDIQFLETFPNLNKLSLICSKISKYFATLQESVDSLTKESVPYLEHTRKLIELLKGETTNHKDELFELLATGMMSPGVHVWLTDYLANVGLTRWQTVAFKCFRNCKSVIFTTVIPLIERLILNYTNFISLSANKSADQIIPKLQALLKNCYEFVGALNEEFHGFKRFLEWLDLNLKSLNEDLSDDKKRVVLKALTEVNTEHVTKFLHGGLESSCIQRFTDKSHPAMTLTRDLQVFLNAKFTILKMEIKKRSKLSNTFTLDNLDLEYFEYCLAKIGTDLKLCVAEGNLLRVYTIRDMTSSVEKTVKFEKHIFKLKYDPRRESVMLLFADKTVEVSLRDEELSEIGTSKLRADFTAYHMAMNGEIQLFVDQHQLMVVPIEAAIAS